MTENRLNGGSSILFGIDFGLWLSEATELTGKAFMAGSKLQDLLTQTASLSGEARERAFDELMRLLMILVRAKMDSKLRNHRESMDVCQSVARNFVEEWQAGKVQFPNEAALVGYLQTVVRNKLTDLSRRDQAARRGGGAVPVPIDSERGVSEGAIPSHGPGASGSIAARETHERILRTLSEEERRLIEFRQRGRDWDEIATELGESSSALRKRWSRLQIRIGEMLAEESKEQ